MADQRQILELLILARQALNGVARFNPKGNPCHDAEGKFSGICSSGSENNESVHPKEKLILKGFEGQRKGYKETIDKATSMIYSVHSVSDDMPSVSLRLMDKESTMSSNAGQYTARANVGLKTDQKGRQYKALIGDPVPVSIEVAKMSEKSIPEIVPTLLHEFGHYIDHAGIPGGSNWKRDHKTDPLFKEWYGAVSESPTIVALEKSRSKLESGESGQHLSSRSRQEAMSSYDYYLRSNEVWARSYAQYIMTKNGQKISNKSNQWSDEEFKPIMKAMDGLFERIGWKK